MIKFTVTDEQEAKIAAWLEEIEPEILEVMKSKKINPANYGNKPYYGAIGGGVYYKFSLTGLGETLVVEEYYTKKELNVTDYSMW